MIPINCQLHFLCRHRVNHAENTRGERRREIGNLVHGIKIIGAAVLVGEGVVPVRPDGGDGGMTALGHHAPQRPRVDEVPPKHHVLHNHVLGGSGIRRSLTHGATTESTPGSDGESDTARRREEAETTGGKKSNGRCHLRLDPCGNEFGLPFLGHDAA